jgi:hypothetical protein
MRCAICGDLLAKRARSQNCSFCSEWAQRVFSKYKLPPLEEAYAYLRRLGCEIF